VVKRVLVVVGVVGLATVMLLVGGLGLARHVRSAPRAAGPPAGVGSAASLRDRPAIPAGSLSQTIASLQAHLRAAPKDWRSYAELGLAYVQQARVSADPTYYPKAQGVLQRSLQLQPAGNFDALTGMAALAAARHDFSGALAWGERAEQANPYNANVYAVIGEAEVELRGYDDAFATFQKMIDLKPDLSTYARVSYAWELQGSYPNAIKAMNLALEAAGSEADAAWASNQLGDLNFNSGKLDRAESYYREGVARDGSFVPPHAGLAKVEAARGDLDAAIRDYTWVVQRYPLPEYVIALGDVYTASGRQDQAAPQYALLHVEERLFQANGVNMDLEIALFDADHGVDLAGGLAAARAEWARRQSVSVADALGWELYANGRYDEALTCSTQALHLGTQNALFYFHQGMIEKALGKSGAARRDLAKALSINPHFSVLWSKPAAAALASLGGAP